jgi:colanic acid/amylovoran biosynthesis protein
MRNYLFINAYSSKNRGDAGIVTAMIHLIRSVEPDAKISVMSSYWKDNIDFYKEYDVDSVEAVWNLEYGNSSIQRYVIGIKNYIRAQFTPTSNHFNYYKNADVIVSVGGGYLYSSRKGSLGVGLLNSLYHIWLAKKFHKKVIGFPQSVGPLGSKLDKYIVKIVLSKMDLFISREQITTKLLRNLNLKNCIEIPDVGFTLPKITTSLKLSKYSGYKVGITLLDWRFANKGATEKNINDYIKKVADACLKLKTKYPEAHFYIIPQVTVGDGDSDLTVSQLLSKLLGDSCSTIIDLDTTDDNKPEQLVDLYSKMDVFIGSRMHSTIFALAGNTPTIALAYQYKTKGTFEAMGLSQYTFSVEDFSSDKIYITLDEILTNKNYPISKVQKNILNVKEKLLSEIQHL